MTEQIRTIKWRSKNSHYQSYPHGCQRTYKSEQHLVDTMRYYIHVNEECIALTLDGEHVWHYQYGVSEKWLEKYPSLMSAEGLRPRREFDRNAFLREVHREAFIETYGFAP